MKTLDRYILRQLITVTFLGVLALTMLLLLGQLFKELHALLVESGAPPSIVFDFIAQVIPFSLTFSVPWGFLTAVLLVYGRLAADNELTSMRMAGLSLWRLSMPAFALGLVLSALCYYINIDVAPRGKRAMSEIVMDAAMSDPRNLLKSSQDAVKLDKVQLYIEKRDGDCLYGLHVYPLGQDDNPVMSGNQFESMHSERAEIGSFDPNSRLLQLKLYNSSFERRDKDAVDVSLVGSMPLYISIPAKKTRRLKPNRFSNSEIDEIVEHSDFLKTVPIDKLEQYAKAAAPRQAFPCAAFLWAEAKADAKFYNLSDKDSRNFRTEGIQRASFACACIVFALIGVPLAITARRRDTSTGFAIGILVAAVYFVALVFCELSRKSAGITPYIVLWLPNLLCAAFALWQHAKAKYRG